MKVVDLIGELLRLDMTADIQVGMDDDWGVGENVHIDCEPETNRVCLFAKQVKQEA